MSLTYLLDTNIILELASENPNQAVIDRVEFCSEHIAIPSSAVYELICDIYVLPQSKQRDRILEVVESILIRFAILNYTENTAHWQNIEEMLYQQSVNKTPELIDAQIAATAKTHHLILVTKDIDSFKYFDGLVLENWFE